MLGTNQKGAIAEQAIMLEAAKLGIPVYRPQHEHERVDLVIRAAGKWWGVQCKWGRLSPDRASIIVRVGGSWWSSNGYVRTTYSENEIDLFAIYCAELNRCFLLPASVVAGTHQLQLRLVPARNSQRACINLADDFDFIGAIAQLGERSAGSRKVAGSNPASSIPAPGDPTTVGSNPFRDKLGLWMERVAGGEEVVVTFRGKPRIRLSPAVPPHS